MTDPCVHHSRSRSQSVKPLLVTAPSEPISDKIKMQIASASSSPSPLLPRLAIATGIGLAAVVVEIWRRARRGPIRKTPPLPQKIPHDVVFGKVADADNGDGELMDPPIVKNDPYFWMRDDDRKDPKVIQHLKQENAYTNYMTLKNRPLVRQIYRELLSHYKQTDSTVPAKDGNYVYYDKTVEGKSYIYHCRKPIVQAQIDDSQEQLILDENQLAAGKKHCDVGSLEISPDDKILAYAVDFSGFETYDIYFKHLDSGKVLMQHTIRNVCDFMEWGPNNSVMFYATFDDAHRPNKIWRRTIAITGDDGQDRNAVAKDVLLYTENDTQFTLYFSKSLSNRFLIVRSDASTLSEERFLDLNDEDGKLRLFREREEGVLYSVYHAIHEYFYVITNTDGATNFKVMRTDCSNPGVWNEFIEYERERKIGHIQSFEEFAVISGREGGYQQLWLMEKHNPKLLYRIETDELAHSICLGDNYEYGTDKLRYEYSSLTTPECVYEFERTNYGSRLLKQTDIPNYKRELYSTERLEAVSNDGTKVPITLVYNQKAVSREGANRLHLYGYGSYELSMDPEFSMKILPLLNRGVIYAIAHVRGGGEYGREWYEAARFENKMKSFEDFYSCAEHLIDVGRTVPSMMSMEGRSAGGMLVGAVLNMRPELFRAAIAGVPFVDVMNTMSDSSIPLTTGEWQEWGNPHEAKFFDAMSRYCPYSNVGEKKYPATLILGGLYDPRVLYSEPVKWAAKLREYTSGDGEILMKIELSSGHFSASNRYSYLREKAYEMAWLLEQLGATQRVADVLAGRQ